jgi:hypothetical protein
MKEIKIKVSNITNKQWASLLIELNLVKDMWRKYGPRLDIKARNFDRIIKWGKKRHGEDTGDIDLTVQRKRSTRENRL